MDSWDQWGNHVLVELKRCNQTLEELIKKLDELESSRIVPLEKEVLLLNRMRRGLEIVVAAMIPPILYVLFKINT